MPLANVSKWLASPIFGGQLKSRFWLIKSQDELALLDPGCHNKLAFAAVVLESVRKKLDDCLLQHLRIDIQYTVVQLHVPDDFVARVRKLLRDFLAQIVEKIRGPVG